MTDAERMERLHGLWSGLLDKVREHRATIPADTLQRFGDSARAFKAAYESPSVLDSSEAASVVWTSDAVRSLYETYAGWAGLLAQYVGRSPLPGYDETPLYNAAVDAERAINSAGSMVKWLGIAVIVYLATRKS